MVEGKVREDEEERESGRGGRVRDGDLGNGRGPEEYELWGSSE